MPRQPENYLKNKIAEGLTAIIKNKELKPLFDPSVNDKKKQLVDDLMSIVPCNPKLLSKIMTLSNIGKQEALISKFSRTRSIQAVACREWRSEVTVLRDIHAMEETMMDHILYRPVDPVLNDRCITEALSHSIGSRAQREGVGTSYRGGYYARPARANSAL